MYLFGQILYVFYSQHENEHLITLSKPYMLTYGGHFIAPLSTFTKYNTAPFPLSTAGETELRRSINTYRVPCFQRVYGATTLHMSNKTVEALDLHTAHDASMSCFV